MTYMYHSDDASAADASAAAADARLRMEPERAQPSMPVKAPDPGAREHDWLPAWFGDVAEFLRAFMIELPQMDKLVFECFFGAVAVCCLWAIVCGYMMLGLVSRQRPGLQKRLPAFAPDFLFQISWLVEFFMLGPCSMIVTKWLMRAADCTYLPDEKVLYFDMSPSTRCYEGAHTVRASLGMRKGLFTTLAKTPKGPPCQSKIPPSPAAASPRVRSSI